MGDNNSHISARNLIKEDGWVNIVPMLVDVLKINIFIVDVDGGVVLPSNNKYGGKFLTDRALGLDLFLNSENIIESFEDCGKYFECVTLFSFHMYAIPLKQAGSNETVAYFIIGPVILNNRLPLEDYMAVAEEKNINFNILLSELNDLRMVSNMTIKLVLDLINETVKNNANLNIREKSETLPISINLYEDPLFDQRAIQTDKGSRILNSFLDTALKITDTECGSIMILDEEKKTLTIRAAKGIDEKIIRNARVRIGEGISGLAIKENSSFLIKDKPEDNRIRHLLKRPEIKQSLVMPLTYNNNIFGVLNLHTKKKDSDAVFNVDTLKSLSMLLSAAL